MDSADMYGPPLPPGFIQDMSKIVDVEQNESEKNTVIGPECPQTRLKNHSGSSSSGSSGPSRRKKSKSEDDNSDVIGPSLPPWLAKEQSNDSSSEDESELSFGPVPAAAVDKDNVNDIVADIEKRAKNMKRKLDGTEDVLVPKLEREEWMMIPDTSKRNQLGAISRCLSHSASRTHRSKGSDKDSKHYKSSKEERKLAKELDKYNTSKRAESLLDMHRKEKKKKKKDESAKSAERKPFNRDDDMSLRMMNKNQVKSVINKAKFLDSRFSRGQSKYL